ncbi:alpha/beta hydrolase [Advenella sp. S44]|uniref:alpha/beta fold hydrolase n=1 Tax=Advenella sp. S44 TaxID=1982755 RepID=UPI000C29C6DB|nr:alpha/beta hydrolase [Advenella sp. S44]PJX25815.1 alpha/beta hydrolase [Advenella sp. S44]
MEQTQTTKMQLQTHRIQTEQGRLYAQSWAWQPERAAFDVPIILFHDSLGCIPLWRDFPANLALATGHPVIAYDRLGFGRSDPHPGRLSADFIADEIRQTLPHVLDAFGIVRFIACGHSVGGAMAVQAAFRFGNACLALITMGAQVFVEELTLNGIRLAKQDFSDPQNLSKLHKYHAEKSRWVVDAWTDTWLSREFSDWNVRQELARIRCPKLAIHGDADPYGSVEHASAIAANDGRAEILSGIGHVPYREDEAQTLEMIKTFISGIR